MFLAQSLYALTGFVDLATGSGWFVSVQGRQLVEPFFSFCSFESYEKLVQQAPPFFASRCVWRPFLRSKPSELIHTLLSRVPSYFICRDLTSLDL